MTFIDILVILVQLALAAYGVVLSWKIYKLINHGNYWWVMSAGFILLFIASLTTLFVPHDMPAYLDIRTLWLPLVIRIAFVFSAFRIYTAALNEHNKLVKEKQSSSFLITRIRQLTEKLEGCPFWDLEEKRCTRMEDETRNT